MKSRYRSQEASETGGLLLKDEENTRSVLLEIIKSLGLKIIQGNFMSLMRVSRPASISYPLTYLEAACRDFSNSEYIERAAETADPIRRIELIVAFLISSLHINPMRMKNKPPLNPILGETYHAWKEDGSQIWLEQTSRHPPTTHWEMRGREGLYKFTGYAQLVGGLSGPNTFHARKEGKNTIEFSDGGTIEFVCPDMEISGLVMGERTVNFVGECFVRDPIHQVRCDIKFGGYQGRNNWLLLKLKNWWSKEKLPSDCFSAVIKQYSETSNRTVDIVRGGGSWLDFLEFNGQEMWHMGTETAVPWIVDQPLLPSDSRFRPDLVALINNDISRAQRAKEDLEDRQRRDKSLRGK